VRASLLSPLAAALVGLTLALLGCSAPTSSSGRDVDAGTPPEDEPALGPAWFEDVTDQVGLDFVHDPGPTGTYFMPQIMGSGCGVIHEPDGTLYLYLLQNAGPKSKSVNRLFKWEPDGKLGRFRDVTEGSGLGVAGWSMGVAVGDVNNDGLPDVLLTQYGGVKLFLNKGGGQFEDVTAEAGLENPLWACSAAFFDYDRDGLLDLFVVNYLDYDEHHVCLSANSRRDYCAPNFFPGAASKLFRNIGPGAGADGKPARVRFADVSFETGIGLLPGPGLGVVCADFDGDGWPDVFVANDGQPNRLWISRRDARGRITFKDEAVSRNIAYTAMGKAFAGMGVAVGDTANSGMLDLFVTHLDMETNTLWKQGPRGRFRDRTVEAGLAATRWHSTGFGTLMADFDCDGSLDVAVVNGAVARADKAKGTGLGFWETYAQRNHLLANDGTGKFRDLSASNKALCGRWNVARGLARLDLDGDGGPDLLVTTIGDRARLFRNVAPNRGHWLAVRAVDPALKRDAYGAEVRVKAGGVERLRLINPAESYVCSSTPVAHFGLSKAAEVESIRVLWPDGVAEVFPGGPADRLLEIRKGEGRRDPAAP
jgi:hypothetical protein